MTRTRLPVTSSPASSWLRRSQPASIIPHWPTFLGGQNSYGAFAEAAPSVNGALMTGSDDAIQRALNDPLAAYLSGTMTEAEMWAAWLDAVRNEFPDLIIPEPPVK